MNERSNSATASERRSGPRVTRAFFAPVHPWVRWWSALLVAPTLYAAIEAPLRIVNGYIPTGALWVIDNVASLLFLADLIFRLVTVARDPNDSARRVPGALRHYLTSDFLVDLLPVVPAILVLPGPLALPQGLVASLAPLVLLRLLKLYRVGQLSDRLLGELVLQPSVLRLGWFVFWLSLTVHWIACGWLALRAPSDFSGTMPHYIEALYWCVTTIATVGYGDITPKGVEQTLYAMLVMVLGVGVYGYVIGSLAGLLANLDAARSRFREKLEQIQAFMSYRHLPAPLRQRIVGYYRYLWESRLGFEEENLLAELPSALRTEVALFLNRPILRRVPFLQGAGEDLLRAIAVALKPIVFSPGDYVFHAGDAGHAMYFISGGDLEVVDREGKVIATIGAGDFFGEIALLGDHKRTAGVRAIDYCDLYALGTEDFERVLGDFPQFAEEVRRMAKSRQAGLRDGDNEKETPLPPQ